MASIKYEFKDCKTIKLGGSIAIVLPKKEFDNSGLPLGFPLASTKVEWNDSECEDWELNYSEVEEMEIILKDWDGYTPQEIIIFAKDQGFMGLNKGEDYTKYKSYIKKEFEDLLKFWKEEIKEFEDSMAMSKEEYEDNHDYDKQGSTILED